MAARLAPRRTLPALLALIALLTACAPTPIERELRNIRAANVVPNTSATALVSTFQKYCIALKSTPDAIPAALALADYVEVPPRHRRTPARLFLVDTKLPALTLNAREGKFSCAVIARSRTGQTNKITAWVAKTYPQAIRRNPMAMGLEAETLWLTTPAATSMIFIARDDIFREPSRLLLGVIDLAP